MKEHSWQLITMGNQVLVGEDDFPKPETRAQAKQLTLSLPHCSTSFSTHIPKDSELIFFRTTQIDKVQGTSEECRTHYYTIGYKSASGEKHVQRIIPLDNGVVETILTNDDGKVD